MYFMCAHVKIPLESIWNYLSLEKWQKFVILIWFMNSTAKGKI